MSVNSVHQHRLRVADQHTGQPVCVVPMMNYLSASELAELAGLKPGQRCRMQAWLTKNRWEFEVDARGLPKVARAYHDRKMGITEEATSIKYDQAPNLQAFC